jgi:hypothetical protein
MLRCATKVMGVSGEARRSIMLASGFAALAPNAAIRNQFACA